MPFHVINLETKQPVRGTYVDGPAIYGTGAAAAEAADAFYRYTGIKHKPLRIKGDPEAWKKRERDRFNDGVYAKLPWQDESWFRNSIGVVEHFAHVSKEKPGMVAFTASEEQGEADTRTRIKPGTYLERFFCDVLTATTIQKYARDFAGRYEINGLKFATTEDDIARVYIHGPRSCMSGPEKGLYGSPMHPARVYAAGDLAVAYLERGSSIIARSVVWPEKKRFYNIYGDSDRMRPLLTKDGYKQGRLDGAKLRRIEYCKQGTKYLVCPHIDGTGRVTVEKDHLIIGGDVPANSSCGLIHALDGARCTNCCSWGHEREHMTHFTDVPNSLYCRSCVTSHTYLCAATNVRYANRDHVCIMGPGVDGRRYWWHRDHFRKHGAICCISGVYLPRDEMVSLRNGDWMTQTHFKEYGFTCSDCGKANHRASRNTPRSNICTYCATPKNPKKAG